MEKTDIRNPDAMGEAELPIINEMQKELENLLDDLKSQNMIRTNFTKTQIDIMINNIQKQIDMESEAYNAINKLVENDDVKEKIKILEDLNVGFTYDNFAYLYTSVSVNSFLSNTEQFKNLLVFLMKDELFSYKGKIRKMMTMGSFKMFLETKSDNAKKVMGRIDIELRNSLAHRLFWMEGNKVFYLPDIVITTPKQIPLHDFIKIKKRHNMLTQALLFVVAKKVKEGFFKS